MSITFEVRNGSPTSEMSTCAIAETVGHARRRFKLNQFRKGEIAQFIWFDTGGAATGWAHIAVHTRAFSHPRLELLPHVVAWNTGEYRDTETAMAHSCINRVLWARWGPPSHATVFPEMLIVGTEDFDRQPNQRGGKEVLSPVRINAMIDYGLFVVCKGVKLQYQGRSMRTQVTVDRLFRWGFEPPKGYRWGTSGKGKDSFAAMQHVITAMRRVKQEADKRPWKLETA